MKPAAPSAARALGVYVHLPWCVRKCPYCDFNSHVATGPLPQGQYVAALLRDLEASAPALAARRVDSVFLGGGTPSLFDGAAIATILNALKEQLQIAPDAEITLEANPGTVEAGRFASYRSAGVNRLSLGAQSFDDRALKALGRIHRTAEIHAAWCSALEAGFTNVNIDLMYGLPGQTLAAAIADVDIAVRLGANHVSHYQLTLEPNTRFYRYPPQLPDEDTLAAMDEGCQKRLLGAGLQRYEVSAYARSGYQARHNLNYWRFGDYLGLGAGAHSKLTVDEMQYRTMRRKNPLSYMRHAGSDRAAVNRHSLSPHDLRFEFMLNRLRLAAPFTALEFEQATGLPFEAVSGTLGQLQNQGLVLSTQAGWEASARGRELLNEVVGRFLPERSDFMHSAAPGG